MGKLIAARYKQKYMMVSTPHRSTAWVDMMKGKHEGVWTGKVWICLYSAQAVADLKLCFPHDQIVLDTGDGAGKQVVQEGDLNYKPVTIPSGYIPAKERSQGLDECEDCGRPSYGWQFCRDCRSS